MKIVIHNTQIKVNTGRACLINIPRSNENVWVPGSLLFKNRDGFSSTLYLPNEFNFRNDTGNINYSSKELAHKFETVNVLNKHDEAITIHHVPEPRKPIKKRAISNDLIR